MQKITAEQAKLINPQVLAFMGDAVHTMHVRTALCLGEQAKNFTLHIKASKLVCASMQCKYAEFLFPHLTEEEQAIFIRARNAKPNSTPKNASLNDYHKATAFEAVIGYLYLSGQDVRLEEIFKLINSNY